MTHNKLPYELEKEFTQLMQRAPSKRLLASDVVAAAKDPNSPLHDKFTWDNGEAAEKWRLQEAQVLIRSFVIVPEEVEVTVRAFTSLETDRDNGGGYRWTMDVMKRPDLREQMILTALHQLEQTRERYAHIQELSSVWEAVDKASSSVTTAV
jgi:hypothetical protein